MNLPTEIFRPRRVLLGLIAAWYNENVNNPRIDSHTMAGQVQIEEILRAFNEASSHVKMEARRPNNESTLDVPYYGVFNGAESWLRDPKSKLCGRADFISAGEILDFKSGVQYGHHIEQIVFYGALYLALTGRPPKVLRLVYTSNNQILDVPVPAMSELESTLHTIRLRAINVDQQVARGELPAKPEQSKCAFCSVRGLCNDYWELNHGLGFDKSPSQTLIIDYTPTVAAVIERAAIGIYIRDNLFGVPSLLHLPQEIVNAKGEQAARFRFLSLRANCTTEHVSLAFTANSEIYIKNS